LIARSLRQYLYASIGIIPNPTSDAENVRLTLHKPAETHALHTSADDEAAGLYFLCHGALSK
jgi:hypothetical protein